MGKLKRSAFKFKCTDNRESYLNRETIVGKKKKTFRALLKLVFEFKTQSFNCNSANMTFPFEQPILERICRLSP